MTRGKVRFPAQAGAFYEADKDLLKKQIEKSFLHKFGPRKIPRVRKVNLKRVVGLVCPHAGYMFSGSIAAHAYYHLAIDGKPDVAVIFGPNHTGYGSALAVMNEGIWRTPLGDVTVDSELANQIVHEAETIDVDDVAHRFEHSIEVQLPFLQYLYGSKCKLVPISFLMQDLASARDVGLAVSKAVSDKNAVLIASSDMTHYESQDKAAKKDRLALKAIEAMDEKAFYSILEAKRMSVCGYGPIAALIIAAKALGGKKATVLSYATSGEVIGDYSRVVGYAAVSLTR